MSRKWRWRKQLTEERGLTLVEILIAVTIMSIISVMIMSYFVAAMDKSAEESRRIIAANLARLKAAELRNVLQDRFDEFGEERYVVTGSTASPALPSGLDLQTRLQDTEINGTVYRYIVELDHRKSDDQAYLMRMIVNVHWQGTETTAPSMKYATSLDTYVVKRW